MTRIGDGLLSFDFGLSGIRHGAQADRLPDQGTAPAVDTQAVLALEALFEAPTAEDTMLAATMPDLATRGVLEPANYAAALEDARTLLLDRATETDGEARQMFAEALVVVEGALDDRAVLDRARLALLRG
jgi:Type III secretion system YscX (type_III_YscX)